MMKLNSIIYLLPVPLAPPIPRPALSSAGLLRTVPNLSAKGFPRGTHHPAALCGLTWHTPAPWHRFDMLRTAWRELVASASTVTTWHRGTAALSVSAPGATPGPPGLTWHTPAPWHHLDTLRTAWRELVASASTVTTWHRGIDAPFSVKNVPVDNFCSASILPVAEKTGTVDKVCKCFNSLNNPLFRTKVSILSALYDGCYVK